MCHRNDRTQRFDWSKVDRALSGPMKRALCALYFDSDLYVEARPDGHVYASAARESFGFSTVNALAARSLAKPHHVYARGPVRMTLSPEGRDLMNRAKDPISMGHG